MAAFEFLFRNTYRNVSGFLLGREWAFVRSFFCAHVLFMCRFIFHFCPLSNQFLLRKKMCRFCRCRSTMKVLTGVLSFLCVVYSIELLFWSKRNADTYRFSSHTLHTEK